LHAHRTTRAGPKGPHHVASDAWNNAQVARIRPHTRVSKTLRDNALHIPNRVLAKPCGSPESESLISRVELTGCAQRPRLVHPLARTSLPEDSRGFLRTRSSASPPAVS
jgi:hypothetical protein